MVELESRVTLDHRAAEFVSSGSRLRATFVSLGSFVHAAMTAAALLAVPAIAHANVPASSTALSQRPMTGRTDSLVAPVFSAGSSVESLGGPAYRASEHAMAPLSRGSRPPVTRFLARGGGTAAGQGARGGDRRGPSGSSSVDEGSFLMTGQPSSVNAQPSSTDHGNLHGYVRTNGADGTITYTNRPEDQRRREQARTPAVETIPLTPAP
jgi:hypothetical protein